jgi:hypothetical protein
MVRSNDMSCISKYRGSRKSCGSYVLPIEINCRIVGPHQYKFDEGKQIISQKLERED